MQNKTFMLIISTAPPVALLKIKYIFLHYALQSVIRFLHRVSHINVITVSNGYFQLKLILNVAVLCNSSVVMHTERNAVWLQYNWREDMQCYHFPDIVVRCVGRWYFGFSLHGLKAVCERQLIQIMAVYFPFYSPCEWHILITKAAPCLALDPWHYRSANMSTSQLW